ncbi:hypothetical protein KM043_011208 [Ampulex compressa]|nr:hypothetical protein KM043_011208 [Ampulex compressa]
MRKLMENQLSWLALFMTAFYSLLASCRGEDCGHEKLAKCARPLARFNGNGLSFVTKKEELEQLCPDFEAGMKCIQTYTVECLQEKQREHFNSLYKSTNIAIMELCQEGPYQDEFLRHAPCMQKVNLQYEQCNKRYQKITQEIQQENRTAGHNGSLKSLCCAFKEFLGCSYHTVRRQCGDDTADFTKVFILDRMSSSLLEMHCAPYTDEECALASGGSVYRIQALVPAVLILLGRYFTAADFGLPWKTLGRRAEVGAAKSQLKDAARGGEKLVEPSKLLACLTFDFEFRGFFASSRRRIFLAACFTAELDRTLHSSWIGGKVEGQRERQRNKGLSPWNSLRTRDKASSAKGDGRKAEEPRRKADIEIKECQPTPGREGWIWKMMRFVGPSSGTKMSARLRRNDSVLATGF